MTHHSPERNEGTHSWLPVSPRYGYHLTKQQARLWALVLDSRAIPCCIEADGERWQLLVPENQSESALRELQLFEKANFNWPPPPPPHHPAAGSLLSTLSVLLLIACFHNLTLMGVTLPGRGIVDLYDLGAANAGAIKSGQWWRLITPLTLHSGIVHLLSNLTIGGTFIALLCREVGGGLAWLLLLLSAAVGNHINALVQAPNHNSVGASTAVFGAVGILATISMVRYRQHLQQRWFVPVAAGLALLAILGTEGKETDLGAHLFGFLAGLCFGTVAEILIGRYGMPGKTLNRLLGALSGAAVLVAWLCATGGDIPHP